MASIAQQRPVRPVRFQVGVFASLLALAALAWLLTRERMVGMDAWRDGPAGALRMGVVHGAWCVGCCWGLMAALFALGVMSLTWMVAVAGLIAIEKLLPSKELASRLVAVTLLALALGVALAPREVPGLTLPGSSQAKAAMRTMSGMHSVGGAMRGHGMAPMKRR